VFDPRVELFFGDLILTRGSNLMGEKHKAAQPHASHGIALSFVSGVNISGSKIN
jgi:hypothetical protein